MRGAAVCAAAACAAAVAAAGLLPPAAAATEVSADVRVLPWRRPVHVPPVQRGDWIEVWDDSLLASGAAAEFADVRFIDAGGVAQTFARREPMLASVWYRPIPQHLHAGRDGAILAGDLGRDLPRGLALRVHATAGGGQFVVESSSDSLHWHPVGAPGVAPQPPGAFDTFDLGSVAERWIRVAAADARLELLERSERRTPREPVPFRITGQRFDGRTWVAELEIAAPALALCRLKLMPRTALAQHAVRVEGRLPNGGWRDLIHTTVQSLPLPDGTARVGAIEWEPFRTRALRLFVDGADAPNAPVTVDSLARTPLRFALPAPTVPMWVAYGDAHVLAAHAPFDLEREFDTHFARAALGPLEANPWHRPPGFGLAWLQRHPGALGVVLIVILAAVAFVVLRRPPRRDA
jgi:hypothetical protein